MVTIFACEDKKSLKKFEQASDDIFGQDPYYVPPFPGSIVKLIGPKSSFAKHGEVYPFIAYREGKPVGRIAAVINHAHNEYYKDKTAFFGFFDFIDDVEVSTALLKAVEAKIKELGFAQLRGPCNPSSNDECGLLVDGFEKIPFLMMPYNPSYYLKHYDHLGLEKARDLFAFYMNASLEAPERIAKIVNRVKAASGLTLRSVDLKNLDKEIPILHELYNVTLDRNWGFIPITMDDLKSTAADLKMIADPNMILIAEKAGKPVGFSLTLPNINEVLHRTRSSRSSLMRMVKFLWHMKTRPPKEARLMVLGVRPEFRNQGIAALFYYETLMRGKRTYVGGELSWVEESNDEIMRGIGAMGAERYKTYRIYEKHFESAVSH